MKKKNFKNKFAEKKQKLIERCTLCGICIEECQIYPFGRFTSDDPVELQEVRIDFLKISEFSQRVYDLAYDCTFCCGSRSSDPSGGEKAGLRCLEEVKNTGSELMVDNCMGCFETFMYLSEDYPFENIHFISLLGQALGIEYEDRMAIYEEWGNVDRIIEDAGHNIKVSDLTEQEIRRFLENYFNEF